MTREADLKNEFNIVSRHGVADIWLNAISNQYSLHATAAFKQGDIITKFFAATKQDYPTYLTVQTGDNTHIILEPTFLQYVNHSCDPNVFFDTTAMHLVCLRPIQCNDELCFFYPSTEWEMARPFVCNCGSTDCLRLVNGAAHLSAAILAKYRLTDFILQKRATTITL